MHFVQLRTRWGSFRTWSQHKNDLLIEMCLVSHNLRRQITLLLEGLYNPESPCHGSRVTLQHTEAYRVTRSLVSGHPAAYRGVPGHPGTRAGSPTQLHLLRWHRSDRCLSPLRLVTTTWHHFGDFSFHFPWVSECITYLNPATRIRHCSTREPLKASNAMRE
jgi:hypothetical protein